MQASLLEIPDHRCSEGKQFDLSTVLYAILAMVAGTNSYRQMHEFIRAACPTDRQQAHAASRRCRAYPPSRLA